MGDPQILGYFSEHGRSSYSIQCGCGERFDFYVWSHNKRCPKCKQMYVYGQQGVATFTETNGEIIEKVVGSGY